MENWSRPYWQECEQKPHLFYVVFGDFEVDDELRQMTSTLPNKLDCRTVEVTYFQDGILWTRLQNREPELAQVIAKTSQAFVVQGEIDHQESLDYLKSTLDFLTYLTDREGVAVHDIYTLSWYGREDWQKRADQGQIFNPFDHVALLCSTDDDGSWLHTRGMLKYGRPDLSLRGVADEELEVAKRIVDRFISFQALGGVMEEGREVVFEGSSSGYRVGAVQGDRDDPDFNNCHVEILK